MNPSDIAIDNFAEVGRLAIRQELKMRLLANKTKEIKDSALAFKLEKVEEAVINHFKISQNISNAEIELLSTSRKIRNKILHCEFDTALKLIENHNKKPLQGPSVKVLHIGDKRGQDLLDAIFYIANGSKSIEELTENEKDLFGWLMQIQQTGGFKEAYKTFIESNKIIERLIRLDP